MESWSIVQGMLSTRLGGLGPDKAAELGAEHSSLGGVLMGNVGARDADIGKLINISGDGTL